MKVEVILLIVEPFGSIWSAQN